MGFFLGIAARAGEAQVHDVRCRRQAELGIPHIPHPTTCFHRHRSPQGFEKTGLGERVATLFVRLFGKSTLGLAYGLSMAEALIAPAMPSTTARAGGIFMPIIKSLSINAGSHPSEYPHPPPPVHQRWQPPE